MKRFDVREFSVDVHLWLGLTLGVLGVLSGITGSILVYDHEIDAWLNPQRYAVSGAQVARPYGEKTRISSPPLTRVSGVGAGAGSRL